jgi:hypothetical protein
MIHALYAPTFRNPRRVALVLGAGALAVAATLAAGRILQIQQRAENRTVEVGATYLAYPSLDALAQRADLIVVGHPVDQGNTHLVAQPAQQATAFQPNPLTAAPGEKAKLAVGQPPATLKGGDPAPPSMDTPVTDFSIEVTRVLHGQVAVGEHVTVSQMGGLVQLPTYPGGPMLKRTIEFEHDTLMAQGQEHVLFLGKAKDGTYFVVGGPQGRLGVDNGGKLHPVDVGAPATRGRTGQTLESFALEVQRSRANQPGGTAE